MFIRLLNETDKELFAKVAYLLSLADNPLLWNGKTKEEVSANADFSKLEVQKDEAEMALLKEWGVDVGRYQQEQVYDALLEKLKDVPLSSADNEAVRITHACFLLEELLSERQEVYGHSLTSMMRGAARQIIKNESGTVSSPAIPKIMLYHLMLMALSDGHITGVEEALLMLFSEHYKIPDFIYEEIQERAEAAHGEVQKTLAIILE